MSLHDASSDLTGRLQELVADARTAGSFQHGQLDLQVHVCLASVPAGLFLVLFCTESRCR